MTYPHIPKNEVADRLIIMIQRRRPLFDQQRARARLGAYDVMKGAHLTWIFNRSLRDGERRITPSTAQKWINGKAIPSPENLNILSRIFAIPADLILYGTRQRTNADFYEALNNESFEYREPEPSSKLAQQQVSALDQLPEDVKVGFELAAQAVNVRIGSKK
jgi:transcriptional regulator with XRE-family HTH domain